MHGIYISCIYDMTLSVCTLIVLKDGIGMLLIIHAKLKLRYLLSIYLYIFTHFHFISTLTERKDHLKENLCKHLLKIFESNFNHATYHIREVILTTRSKNDLIKFCMTNQLATDYFMINLRIYKFTYVHEQFYNN